MTDSELSKALKKISEDGGQAFLITNVGCQGCEEAKEMLKTEIEQGQLKVADYQESDEAVRMASALDILEVPNIVAKYPDKVCLIDEETGAVKKCKITKKDD